MNQEVSQVESQELKTFLDDTFDTMEKVLEEQNPELRQYEIGTVQFVGRDIARVSGLPHIRAEELVRFSGNYMGLVFNIDPKEIGVILLDPRCAKSVNSVNWLDDLSAVFTVST